MTLVQTIMLELVVMRACRSPPLLLLLLLVMMQQLMREMMMMLMMSMRMRTMTTMTLDKVCDVTELSGHIEVSAVCLRSVVDLADSSTNGCKTVCLRLLFISVFMIHIDYICCKHIISTRKLLSVGHLTYSRELANLYNSTF